MRKASKLFLAPLMILLSVALITGCGDSAKTSVDPTKLDDLTNNFTQGSGEIDNATLLALLSQTDLIAGFGGDIPEITTKSALEVNAKSGLQDVKAAFKPLEKLNIPGMNKLFNLIMNYAVVGSPLDPSGTVEKLMGISNSFNAKITGDQIGYPSCMYISGLPSSIEKLITGEEMTAEDLASLVDDIEGLIASFNITFGFEGDCAMNETPPPTAIATGSVNLKGGFAIKETSIKGSAKLTFSNLQLEVTSPVTPKIAADPDITMTILATGALGLDVDSTLGAEDYEIDFVVYADKFAVDMTTTDETADNVSYHVDGAIALNATGDTVAYEDLAATVKPDFQVDLSALEGLIPTYVPDICNSEIVVVIDFSFLMGDPAGVEGTDYIAFDILMGVKVTMNDDSGDYCASPDVPVVVYVLFITEKQFYLAKFKTGGACSGVDYYVNFTGDAGWTLNACVDVDAPACTVDLPTGSSVPASVNCDAYTLNELFSWL